MIGYIKKKPIGPVRRSSLGPFKVYLMGESDAMKPSVLRLAIVLSERTLCGNRRERRRKKKKYQQP